MHISWLGQTCLKLQTKHNEEDVIILIDPYRPEKGDFPRNLGATVGLFSRGEKDAITLTGEPFIISTLGEFEIKDVMIYAYPHNDGTVIFKVHCEGISLLHLGQTKTQVDTALLDKIGNVDVLVVPVGDDKRYFDPEDAAKVITELEPRVIIPIGHKCDTDPGALPVNDFIKELGLKPEITDKKIILKKKDLPQEDRKLYVLEKNY